jgi:hypothetical protein
MDTFVALAGKALPTSSRLFVACCCALVLTGISAETASAHKPLFKAGDISSPARALAIPDPNVSWAIYASLDRPGEADFFSFHTQSGLALNAQITLPAIKSLEQFAPHLALLGAGLPPASPGQVPFAVPDHDGVQVINATQAGTADRFNEPFTQTTYWNRQTLKEPLRTAGTYYLVVFNLPTDRLQTGKYVLAVGTIEQFGPGDLLSFSATYVRVRFFTEAGLPLWSWLALALIALLFADVAYLRRWRRNRNTGR